MPRPNSSNSLNNIEEVIQNFSEEDIDLINNGSANSVLAKRGIQIGRESSTLDGLVCFEPVPHLPDVRDAGNGQAKYQPRGVVAAHLSHQSHLDLIAHARLHMSTDAVQAARLFGEPLYPDTEEHIWEPIDKNYKLNYICAADISTEKDSPLPSSEYERLHQINAAYEAKWMYHNTNVQLAQADINIDWAFRFGCSYSSRIGEDHPDWSRAFNVFRRRQGLPSIELKVGNTYVIQYKNGKTQRMELVRIVNPDGNFPECYFKDCMWPGKGATNIGIMKILNDTDYEKGL